MVGGIDAFIKLPQGWPLSDLALELISLKSTSQYSKEISLSFLCKILVSGVCVLLLEHGHRETKFKTFSYVIQAYSKSLYICTSHQAFRFLVLHLLCKYIVLHFCEAVLS